MLSIVIVILAGCFAPVEFAGRRPPLTSGADTSIDADGGFDTGDAGDGGSGADTSGDGGGFDTGDGGSDGGADTSGADTGDGGGPDTGDGGGDTSDGYLVCDDAAGLDLPSRIAASWGATTVVEVGGCLGDLTATATGLHVVFTSDKATDTSTTQLALTAGEDPTPGMRDEERVSIAGYALVDGSAIYMAYEVVVDL